MSITPVSKQKWLNVLLFPLKAYVIIIPVWGVIQTQESFHVREAQSDAAHYLLWIYALSIPIFILAAIVQFFAHHQRPAIENALFAVAALAASLFLLPMFALAR